MTPPPGTIEESPDMTNTPMTHHHIKAKWQNDEHGPGILLTQQSDYSEPDTVLMHPHQLRALCEHFGLMTADPQAAKTITTLQRRMLALRDRIDDLGHYMTHHSDHKHADLSHELNTINMLAELADEWCADFEDTPTQVAATTARPVPTEAQQAPGTTATPAQAALL